MTILMVVHNQIERAKLCIESIRNFADVNMLQVVVIDNASTDGLSDWLAEQEDIAWAGQDGKMLGFGQAIKEACELFKIEDDLLLLSPEVMITPGFLRKMEQVLQNEKDAGVVGMAGNRERLSDFEETLDAAMAAGEEASVKPVIGLFPKAMYVKKCVWQKVLADEESFVHPQNVMADLCCSTLRMGFRIYGCSNGYLYDMADNEFETAYWEVENLLPDRERLSKKWGMHYFNGKYNRKLVRAMSLLEKDKNAKLRILEVGCDCGATLAELQYQYPNAQVYGYEINESAVKIAECVAEVKVGNLEEEQMDYDKESFDYILFGDVLEHLHNPLATLKYCRDFLKEKGKIIASIPNLQHVSVIRELLKGNFTYTNAGLLDRTHIHFFTYNEILKIFEQADYKVLSVEGVGSGREELGEKEYIDKLLCIEPGTPRHMYETYQYTVCAEKVFAKK